ncbi:hypothetical protein GCM10010912_31450 [Paenibacillus albidus]|uniref:Uncharacterized protein n=2 Tax=Paenibacillus albidus TaxID=2041023 RepID=A0A917CEU9_9BACL|nr:hypothetical protein GCM10010912_31450 [Paenibacillus albidus]
MGNTVGILMHHMQQCYVSGLDLIDLDVLFTAEKHSAQREKGQLIRMDLGQESKALLIELEGSWKRIGTAFL